uniref:Uncharacterized protein n=1 Tax=Arion vulgaris TaxID=1028688 RepID=A0A0B7ASN4_9EUPU
MYEINFCKKKKKYDYCLEQMFVVDFVPVRETLTIYVTYTIHPCVAGARKKSKE